ncbi:MAG: shikimate kinase [Anaerolineae bacterium]
MKELTRPDLPFKNLTITGFLGVGKSTVARTIANRLGTSMFDIDDEIELRELMSITKIREQYGDSRLRKLEHELSREAALMRRAVIVMPGAALRDGRNYRLMEETSIVICLMCELGEALRRLHLKNEIAYRDPQIRGRMIGRIRRESEVVNDPRILQLDTTHLTVDEQVDLLIDLWAAAGEPGDERFRYGPPPRITPPRRTPVGLTGVYDVRPTHQRG